MKRLISIALFLPMLISCSSRHEALKRSLITMQSALSTGVNRSKFHELRVQIDTEYRLTTANQTLKKSYLDFYVAAGFMETIWSFNSTAMEEIEHARMVDLAKRSGYSLPFNQPVFDWGRSMLGIVDEKITDVIHEL